MLENFNQNYKKEKNCQKKNLSLLSFFLLIFLCWPFFSKAKEASFFVLPETGSFRIGQSFNVSVYIASEGAAMNAAQAKLTFPPQILEVAGISKTGSIFTLWVQEPVWSNSQGEISFGGGLSSPGYRGSSAKVITVTFKGKTTGRASIGFKEEMVLENSASAPNIFSKSNGAVFAIFGLEVPEGPRPPLAPEITSPTHPIESNWYPNNNPSFQWQISADISDVSYLFDKNPSAVPDNVSEGKAVSEQFSNIDDGVWHFHLKAKNSIGWGSASHFKIQIDTSPPGPFDVTVDNEGDETNPYPFLFFHTEDSASGVAYYEVRIGDGEVLKALEGKTTPFRMPFQALGAHPVSIKAFDYAQNFTESKTLVEVKSIDVPEITVAPENFLSGKEMLYLEGKSIPNVEVIIFLKRGEELIKTWQVQSNNKGEWYIKEEGLFKSGQYQIEARAKDGRGAVSNPSEPRYVKVSLSGIAFGPFVFSFQAVVIFCFVLLILAFFILFYVFWRTKEEKERIFRETEDLKNKFYKEFRELEADIKRELETLRWLRGRRETTKEEEKRERDLLKNLKDVKEVFRKELRDIEDIISS